MCYVNEGKNIEGKGQKLVNSNGKHSFINSYIEYQRKTKIFITLLRFLFTFLW